MVIKVAAVIGSVRKDSLNLKLVEYMKKRYADKLDIVPVFINDVPLFNPELENDLPQGAIDFNEQIRDAEAVLFAVPEYNYSIPGGLKNATDWLSRGGNYLIGKPTFIIGSSMGVLGSVRAQIHFREILSNPALAPRLLPGNEVYIGSAHEKINEENDITDADTVSFLDSVVDNFVEFYNKTV